MKKALFSFAAIASMLMLGACSSEEPAVETAGAKSTVAVELQLPDGLQSRYGEGTTATDLTYAVYDHGKKEALAVCTGGADATIGKATMSGLKTTITLQLTTGKEYDFVFFAAAPNSIYSFDKADQTVTANYTGLKANEESLDAFFNTTTYKVVGNATISAKLYRPFAQLNILTDDVTASSAAGFAPQDTKVVVKDVANKLNLVTGAVEGEAELTYDYNALAAGKMTIKGKDYDYLAMNYLLVNEKKTVEVGFGVKSTKNEERAITFNNVPVQRNFRTNIYGSLLTNALNVNVEIIPGFNEPDYEVVGVSDAETLVSELTAGNNVALTADINLDQAVILNLAGKEATIDLNGHNIIGSKKFYDTTVNVWSVLSVRGGKLTINGDGNVFAATGAIAEAPNYIEDFAIDVNNGAQLVINGGNFKGNDTAVYIYSGSVEINGGTFEVYDNGLSYGARYNINAYDSAFTGGTAKITIKGGTFFEFDPTKAPEAGSPSLLPAGYKAVKTSINGKDAWVVSAE